MPVPSFLGKHILTEPAVASAHIGVVPQMVFQPVTAPEHQAFHVRMADVPHNGRPFSEIHHFCNHAICDIQGKFIVNKGPETRSTFQSPAWIAIHGTHL